MSQKAHKASHSSITMIGQISYILFVFHGKTFSPDVAKQSSKKTKSDALSPLNVVALIDLLLRLHTLALPLMQPIASVNKRIYSAKNVLSFLGTRQKFINEDKYGMYFTRFESGEIKETPSFSEYAKQHIPTVTNKLDYIVNQPSFIVKSIL